LSTWQALGGSAGAGAPRQGRGGWRAAVCCCERWTGPAGRGRVGPARGDAGKAAGGRGKRQFATTLIERVGLKQEFATIEALRQRVEEIEKRIGEVITDIAKTRISLSFAYEYSRVSEKVNLLQATLDRSALKAFHADLIRAQTRPITAKTV